MTDAVPDPSIGRRPLLRPAGPQDRALIEEALTSDTMLIDLTRRAAADDGSAGC